MSPAPFLLVKREGLAKLVPHMKVGERGINHCKVYSSCKIALEASQEPQGDAGAEEKQ